MAAIFPQRPWLRDAPPPRFAATKTADLSGLNRRAADPADDAGADGLHTWKACDWEVLPRHWSEENDLPPLDQRPLVMEVGYNDDDDGEDIGAVCMRYMRNNQAIGWDPRLTLGNAKETSDALASLKRVGGFGADSGDAIEAVGLNSASPSTATTTVPFIHRLRRPGQWDDAEAASKTQTQQQTASSASSTCAARKWAGYAFLFFLLLAVVVYTVVTFIGTDAQFLPGHALFADYTAAAYAAAIFSLGVLAQIIL